MKLFLVYIIFLTTAIFSKELVIAGYDNYPPYSFLNKDNKPTGLLIDIWSEWAKSTQNSVKFNLLNEKDSLQLFKDKKVDIHTSLYSKTSNSFYIKTMHKSELAIFSQKDFNGTLRNQKVGVLDLSFAKDIKKDYPNLKVIVYENNIDICKAMNNKSIDLFIDNLESGLKRILKVDNEHLLKLILTISQGVEALQNERFAFFQKKDIKELVKKTDKTLNNLHHHIQSCPDFTQRYISENIHNILDMDLKKLSKIRELKNISELNKFLEYSKVIESLLSVISNISNKTYKFELNQEIYRYFLLLSFQENKWKEGISFLSIKSNTNKLFLETLIKAKIKAKTFLDIFNHINKDIHLKSTLFSENLFQDYEFLAKNILKKEISDVSDKKHMEEILGNIKLISESEKLLFLKIMKFSENIIENIDRTNSIYKIVLLPKSYKSTISAFSHDKNLSITISESFKDISIKTMEEIEKKWIKNEKDIFYKDSFFTFEEVEWIKSNVVTVGVEQWSPLVFMNSQNKIDGITSEFLEKMIEKSGLKIDLIPNDWGSLLNNFRDKKIDILPATYHTEERATFGLYTSGYLKMKDYIYVLEDNLKVNALEDLSGKKLGLISGYGTIDKIKSNFPEINIVYTKDLDDSINRLLNGEIDAIYDGQIAVEQKIKDEMIQGLRGVAQHTFKAPAIHFFSHIDKPILRDILEKSLNSISLEDRDVIFKKWLSSSKASDIIAQFKDITEVPKISFTGIISVQNLLIALIIFGLLSFYIYKNYSKFRFMHIKLKKFNLLIISFELIVISVLIYKIILLDRMENSLVTSQNEQINMLHILSNLKDDSDSLTSFARNYIVTENSKFLDNYYRLIKIRDGEIERPIFYNSIYWNLDSREQKQFHPNGEKISLDSLISRANFNKSEFGYILNSQDKSDSPFDLEAKAFRYLENNQKDLAINILYSIEYFQAKTNAMTFLDKAIISLEFRSKKEINLLDLEISKEFIYILAIALFFIIGNFLIYHILVKKVNKPILYLTDVIRKIKSGNKDIEIKNFFQDEIGETIKEFFFMKVELENKQKFLESVLNSQSSFVLTTDGKELRTVNKAFLDFYEVSDAREFKDSYGNCICDTFTTDKSSDFILKNMNGEKWVDYIFDRPDETHKTSIVNKADGKTYIFSITVAELIFNDFVLKTVVFTDISELEKSRHNTESILANILLPVLITSKKDRIISYANKYAEILYEIKRENLIGLHIDEVYSRESQSNSIKQLVEKQGYLENYEDKFKTQSGREFTALLSVTSLEYNESDSYIGMVTDISKQKEIEEEIREIHKNTRDSIKYASLIQHSIIPEENILDPYFSDSFTMWNPKDIVGGDIYLIEKINEDETLIMVIDCTGHGVPGAFVTMLVKAIEREIFANIMRGRELDSNYSISPSWILSYFNREIKSLLKQHSADSISNAGFDGGIIYYNKKDNILKFSGAETPLFYIENGEFKTIKGSRHSVGYKKSDVNFKFKESAIEVVDGMQFYLTTDGYLDQNGGEKSFPFGKKRFGNIIKENFKKSFSVQESIFKEKLNDYQGDEDRNDDITLIGIKV